MAGAVERIVVQVTAVEKKAIAGKAKRMGIPVSELMRRGASGHEAPGSDADLEAMADAALAAAERAGAAVDEALAFVKASNLRIAALETMAARGGVRKAA
ncbi:MAG: hypothetical protein ABI277_04030 [Burkholderiaceae bacterium]